MPKAAIVIAGIVIGLLTGCSDPYRAPPVQPGVVILNIVPAKDVPRDCGHPEEDRVAACYRSPKLLGAGAEIIMPPPREGDYAWLDLIRHELAHASGWRHPEWRGGIE